jgi:hypothetical protein
MFPKLLKELFDFGSLGIVKRICGVPNKALGLGIE